MLYWFEELHVTFLLLQVQYHYLSINNHFINNEYMNSFPPFLINSLPRSKLVNVVLLFSDSHNDNTPKVFIQFSVYHLLPFTYFYFPPLFLRIPPRSSSVKVLFFPNDSKIIFAPSAPILFPLHFNFHYYFCIIIIHTFHYYNFITK